MKRLLDFILSLMLIIAFSIPMLIVAILILVSMGRPILFKQERPGLHSKPFYIYKFRTMTNERDSNGELLANEERITKIGKIIRKLSLDELPQLFNVLKGDMSFVGPRPLLMSYLSLYNEEQARRHEVKPGITGWAQVNGRNNVDWDTRFKLDLYYVENHSFLFDLKIFYMTIVKVFKREDVNPNDKEFKERFKGNN